MPVVTLYHDRLKTMMKKEIDEIIDSLPYIALDIEEQGEDYVRVEYNPNRPDFSTDYGIVRALKGLMDIETGLPKYKQYRSNITINVDKRVKKVRPYIVSLLAMNGRLDSETIRQIIAMQEDIHDGIGRKRRKVSIGIHNYDVIKPPFLYTVERSDFKFIPLNESKEMSIKEILNTDIGIRYRSLLSDMYPIIKDKEGKVLSFPPIINSELTRVSENTKNLFIEATATDLKTAEDALAIIAMTLFDAGFKISSVKIDNGKKIETPVMDYTYMKVKQENVKRLLGLDLRDTEIIKYLRRSRLDGKEKKGVIECIIPRYRLDILHEVDILEDIAIGYGIYRIGATYPFNKASGAREKTLKVLDHAREVLIGLGIIEVMNFNLISRDLEKIGIKSTLSVEQTKSIEHEILRSSLIPSLMLTLSRNIHEPYPQRIFEVGKVFHLESGIKEEWNISVVIAHKEANYTEAKSHLQAMLRMLFDIEADTPAGDNIMLKEGRRADIIMNGKKVGILGEVNDGILEDFKLRVPASLFEVSITKILDILNK